MEGKPDDASPSFHPRFKPVEQPPQPQEQEVELAMGEVTSTTQQEFTFPLAMDTGAGPWPLLLQYFPGAPASTTCTNAASSAVTNPAAQLLPPFVPRLPYGYEGLLLPHDASSSLGLYRPSSSGASPFGPLHPDYLGKMTAQEIMDAKALAASRSHSEAERRRRERINGHLARLRSLLPSTTKTDKASLLAEVIQHVKELKRQTSEIAEERPVPTETDELSVDVVGDDEAGSPLVKASLCCDDRPDLLPELIKTLRAMRMRALKAEIVTLGGRVRNVLLMTGQDAAAPPRVEEIQEALRAAMEKAAFAATAAADEPSTSTAAGAKGSGPAGSPACSRNGPSDQYV